MVEPPKKTKRKRTKKNKRKKVPPPLHEEEEEEEEFIFMDFEKFWLLVGSRGRVAHFYQSECEYLWSTFTPEQQQAIYDAVNEKLQTGRFVHYNPANAIRDNMPKAPRTLVISAQEYYRRYGTQTNLDGWVRTFLPEQQKTIYIKHE